MNKEKWIELYEQECDIAYKDKFDISPHGWGKIKEVFLKIIKNTDEATEVYFMENPKEKSNGSA